MILIGDPDRRFAERVIEYLGGEEGHLHVERLGDLDRLVRERPDRISAVLLGPNLDVWEALDTAGRLNVTARVGMVLIARECTPDMLRTAMRSGLRDVLTHPFTADQFQDALTRARQYTEQFRAAADVTEAVAGSGHRVVSVFSTKGGCGKSMVASNLAVLLAQRTGEDVALVDLDLQSGDLAIMLQLLPAWTIHDAVENLDRLDGGALRGYMTEHRGGIKLLAAPVDPSQGDAIKPKAVHRILHILREEFPFVVVDTPPLFTDEVLAALDESDECVLLTSMDIPSIKNLKLALQTLDKLGLPRERVRLLLNRADSNVGLRLSEVEKSIGTHVDVAVPSSRDVPLSVNQGVPLALERRRSPIVEPLARLADDLAGPHTTERASATEGAEHKRRGLLRRG